MAPGSAASRAVEIDAALSQFLNTAATIGFVLDRRQLNCLRCYLEMLLLWGRRTSLVSQDDPSEIVRKHCIDSLLAARRCSAGDSVVDLGSGAGFPGLVIAIVRPDVEMCLVDSNRKKASFLFDVVARAAIGNVHVVEGRIEKVCRDDAHFGKYSLAISRALGRLEQFLSLARPFLRSEGWAISMKGPRYPFEIASLPPDRCGFAHPEIEEYKLPDGVGRALLCFAVLKERG